MYHSNGTVQTLLVSDQWVRYFFFFNDTATTEIYTLSLHDALPIYAVVLVTPRLLTETRERYPGVDRNKFTCIPNGDRKSTRLNSSHSQISYAVFCLKKKQNPILRLITLYCAFWFSIPCRQSQDAAR